MNNQDEITVRGRVFIAIDGNTCMQCDLKWYKVCHSVPCMAHRRLDWREVIFVEKQ